MLKSKRGKAAEWVTCKRCGKEFLKEVYNIRQRQHHYCSGSCSRNEQTTRQYPCDECGELVTRVFSVASSTKTSHIFCCQSHAATFNNRLRKKTRRSKIETAFFDRLSENFPKIEMIPNDKTMLPGIEVDISIPELRMAIEWNGVVHFQPIYGQEKLEIIQKRDAMKTHLAAELGIRLIVISDADSSKKTLDRAYSEVCDIISSLL